MARETAIDKLSAEHRRWLDERLMREGFNGYEALADWLQGLGYEIGKSSVHRYGQKLERKLAAVQASTQAALMIADASPDDGDARSQAVLSLVQTELFNALIDLQSAEEAAADPAKRIAMLSRAGKGISEIVKASVLQKQHAIDVRDKAQQAADEVQAMVTSGGLSEETAELIRAKILGIVE